MPVNKEAAPPAPHPCGERYVEAPGLKRLEKSLVMSLDTSPQPSPLPSHSSSRSFRGALLLAGLLISGCSLDPLEPAVIPELDSDEIDPKAIFVKRVQPEISKSCSCHYTKQMDILPFLENPQEPDKDYAKITAYSSGKFLTAVPEQSALLTKGKHQGPAFSDVQFLAVRGWLDVEATTRGLGKGSPTTPSVPIRDGEYFLAIDKFTKDPLSKITFTMKMGSSNAFVVSDLKITAGPATGIKVKHPRIIFITAAGTTPDPSDALQTVDLTVMQSMSASLGSGTLRLTGVPASAARVAMAFESISPTIPDAPPPVCKSPMLWNPAVLNTLKACALQCHSPGATDRTAGSATGAFNMAASLGTDQAALASLCVYTLSRVNLADIPRSPLIRQPQPVTLGGTTNHPFKFSTDATSNMFQMAVTTWGMAEK
jgi:hypothetical protein